MSNINTALAMGKMGFNITRQQEFKARVAAKKKIGDLSYKPSDAQKRAILAGEFKKAEAEPPKAEAPKPAPAPKAEAPKPAPAKELEHSPSKEEHEALNSLRNWFWRRVGGKEANGEGYSHKQDMTHVRFKTAKRDFSGYWNEWKPLIHETGSISFPVGDRKAYVNVSPKGVVRVHLPGKLSKEEADKMIEHTLGSHTMPPYKEGDSKIKIRFI